MKIERPEGAINNYETFRIGEVNLKMKINDDFAGLRTGLQQAAARAIEHTSQYISLHRIDLSLKNDPQHVIPGFAHAGWTSSDSKIQIKVDPTVTDVETLLQIELPRSVSHELHHAVRERALPNEENTLGEMLIKEGLATVFETEIWGGEPSTWSIALTSEQIQDLLVLVKAEHTNKQFDHSRWFFGTGDLPKWAGYAIGNYLIREYLEKHPTETAASLVGVSSGKIFKELMSA